MQPCRRDPRRCIRHAPPGSSPTSALVSGLPSAPAGTALGDDRKRRRRRNRGRGLRAPRDQRGDGPGALLLLVHPAHRRRGAADRQRETMACRRRGPGSASSADFIASITTAAEAGSTVTAYSSASVGELDAEALAVGLEIDDRAALVAEPDFAARRRAAGRARRPPRRGRNWTGCTGPPPCTSGRCRSRGPVLEGRKRLFGGGCGRRARSALIMA